MGFGGGMGWRGAFYKTNRGRSEIWPLQNEPRADRKSGRYKTNLGQIGNLAVTKRIGGRSEIWPLQNESGAGGRGAVTPRRAEARRQGRSPDPTGLQNEPIRGAGVGKMRRDAALTAVPGFYKTNRGADRKSAPRSGSCPVTKRREWTTRLRRGRSPLSGRGRGGPGTSSGDSC
jgi:hypothetical protein